MKIHLVNKKDLERNERNQSLILIISLMGTILSKDHTNILLFFILINIMSYTNILYTRIRRHQNMQYESLIAMSGRKK